MACVRQSYSIICGNTVTMEKAPFETAVGWFSDCLLMVMSVSSVLETIVRLSYWLQRAEPSSATEVSEAKESEEPEATLPEGLRQRHPYNESACEESAEKQRNLDELEAKLVWRSVGTIPTVAVDTLKPSAETSREPYAVTSTAKVEDGKKTISVHSPKSPLAQSPEVARRTTETQYGDEVSSYDVKGEE